MLRELKGVIDYIEEDVRDEIWVEWVGEYGRVCDFDVGKVLF